jgi:hypothetical protein
MIHAARKRTDPLSLWGMHIAYKRHANVAARGDGNKMARIAWAMIRNGTHYQHMNLAGVAPPFLMKRRL